MTLEPSTSGHNGGTAPQRQGGRPDTRSGPEVERGPFYLARRFASSSARPIVAWA